MPDEHLHQIAPLHTHITPRESLSGIGKSIHEIGEKMEELQQKSISRYHLFTITRRGVGEEKCYGTEECRAYKEISLRGEVAFSSP